MIDSIKIYRSFHEAINQLETKEAKSDMWDAIMEYVFNNKITPFTGISNIVWTLIKPNLDSSMKSYNEGKSGGYKGKGVKKPRNKNTPSNTPLFKNEYPPILKTNTPSNSNNDNNSNNDIDNNTDKDKKRDKDDIGATPIVKVFVPPTLIEVENEMIAKGLTKHEAKNQAEIFMAHFENRDWKFKGGRKMKSWKLSIVTWLGNYKENRPLSTTQTSELEQWRARHTQA